MKYLQTIEAALNRSSIPFKDFHNLHGKMQHVAQIMPLLKGFMTPLNAQLKKNNPTVGLGDKSEVREVLQHLSSIIEDLQRRPTHALELISTYLP